MGPKKVWNVYIVRCCDGSFYTGITNQLENRIICHNKGKGSRYTRSRTPVQLVYCKKVKNRSLASVQEAKIKKLSRNEKMELIRQTYPITPFSLKNKLVVI